MPRERKKVVMLTARVEPSVAQQIEDGCTRLKISRSDLLVNGALNELRRRLRSPQAGSDNEELATPDTVSC
jgi:hypothetical protein